MISTEQLRRLYITDLSTPDPHHDRPTKVRHIKVWESIPMFSGVTRPIDPYNQDVWIWSDTHFGHKNIIKYTEPHRPYGSVDEMNEQLIANYCRVVKPSDISIWVGDIAFMSATAMNEILDTLPGYKIWIIGNHDLTRKGDIIDYHFDERHIVLPINITEPDGFSYQLLLTHYPLSTVPRNAVSVHGHIHQHQADPWNINVSVEQTNCTPLNLRHVCTSAREYLTNG